jgi:WS/DGAT/MGAT family acyltransferase
MHVGWFSVLELPAGLERLDLDELKSRIDGRLHLLPRFRQRVTTIPLGAGEPVWRDDPEFDLDDHVREVPATLAGFGVRQIADAFFSCSLRRDRPLWEIVLIPRMGAGRAAILGKIHHCMVDGVAAVELGMLLFELAPDVVSAAPQQWIPAPTQTPVRLALDAVVDTALEQFRVTRRMAGLARSPRQTVRVANTVGRAALQVAGDALRPAPPSYLNVEIGPTRTLTTHDVALERLLALKQGHGVKLNDIVLVACAGALRRFAVDRGAPPIDLRVMVPVNVRRQGEDTDGTGNKITFGFIDLPIFSDRVEERLRRVVESMNVLKSDGRIEGSTILLSAAGMLPEPLKDRAARFAASPRLYNLIVSNVPGPRTPLYVCGAKVESIHPVIPTPDLHALSIGVLTYNGTAHFSFYADPSALPGSDSLPIALEEAVIELEDSLRPPARHGARARAGAMGARRGAVHNRTRQPAERLT